MCDSVPFTVTEDSEEGVVRVPTHAHTPTMKQVLLTLNTCDYCGEAVLGYSTCCPACDGIYGDIPYDDDDLGVDTPEERRAL